MNHRPSPGPSWPSFWPRFSGALGRSEARFRPGGPLCPLRGAHLARFRPGRGPASGTCLVPLGILEKHGPHLPLGTDLINCREVALRAAAAEYAVVFPPYFVGQIFEAKHQPGTIAYGSRMMLDLLQQTCDELARNGFKKIVLVNGHGGNDAFLHYFCQSQLETRRDYVVYLFAPEYDEATEARLDEMRRTALDGRGRGRDLVMLAHHPDLARMRGRRMKAARTRSARRDSNAYAASGGTPGNPTITAATAAPGTRNWAGAARGGGGGPRRDSPLGQGGRGHRRSPDPFFDDAGETPRDEAVHQKVMKRLYDLANLALLVLTGLFHPVVVCPSAGPHPDAFRPRGTAGPLRRAGLPDHPVRPALGHDGGLLHPDLSSMARNWERIPAA